MSKRTAIVFGLVGLFGLFLAANASSVATSLATVVQPVAALLNATVSQATAANLNATVVQSTAANLNVLPARNSTTTVPGPTAGLALHCDYSAGIAGGAAASTVIINGVASNRIIVCGYSFTSGGTGTVVLAEATTGSGCTTGVANRTGIYPVVAGTAVNFTPGDAFAFNTVTAGKDVCVITTGTATAQGIMSFMVRP